jgi:hypothetical protein
LAPNTRLCWKSTALANTLAYYDTAKNAALKRFITLGPSLTFVKALPTTIRHGSSFRIVTNALAYWAGPSTIKLFTPVIVTVS